VSGPFLPTSLGAVEKKLIKSSHERRQKTLYSVPKRQHKSAQREGERGNIGEYRWLFFASLAEEGVGGGVNSLVVGR
jgi:hypothetical protein